MRRLRSARITLLAAALVAAVIVPVSAQTRSKSERGPVRAAEIKIGVGHGIGFLPLYLAQDLKLLEKHAKAAGITSSISLQRYNTAAPLQQAIAKGDVTAGAYGLSAFLLARDTPKEMVAVSGLTTLPLVLLTARSNIKSLSDLRPNDRIAVPMLTAPQTAYLRMQADKSAFGAWNRLRQQIVAMPHQDALDALATGKDNIAAYFSSPPFTQVALKEPKVRALMSSDDIMGGKTSFLVIAASRETMKVQPKLAEILSKAIDEASAIIRNDPRRAAVMWLKYEPSNTLDARAVEAILRDLKDDFGSGIFGVEATASFMNSDGRLKNAPASWKDVVAPVLASGSGS
jgi:NitT/TauT family transport system substrate-binding protein